MTMICILVYCWESSPAMQAAGRACAHIEFLGGWLIDEPGMSLFLALCCSQFDSLFYFARLCRRSVCTVREC